MISISRTQMLDGCSELLKDLRFSLNAAVVYNKNWEFSYISYFKRK